MRRKAQPPSGGMAGRGAANSSGPATQKNQSPRPFVSFRGVAGNKKYNTAAPLRVIAHVFLEHDGSLSVEPHSRIRPDDLERLRAVGWAR
jgi:hypothetical protein